MLASLRRAGAPYRLTPTELAGTTMVTSGAVTKRVDRLVQQGLVERSVSETDGRGRVIALTPAGKEVQERLHPQHLANEERLVAALDAERAPSARRAAEQAVLASSALAASRRDSHGLQALPAALFDNDSQLR